MKQLIGILLCFVFALNNLLQAQCSSVTVEAYQVSVGNYKVRATLAFTYSQTVSINGSITPEPGASTDVYSITVPAGSLTGQTDDTWSLIDPNATPSITVSNVIPCPTEYAEGIAASYSLSNHTYTIDLSPNDQNIKNALAESFSLEDPTIDSIKINDDDPATVDSVAYLVFYVTDENRIFSTGLNLDKENDGNDHILYSLNNSTVSVARAWECKTQTSCSECDGKRNWFLGAVKGCKCIEAGEANNDCKFNTSGSGFPWGPVLGLLGVLISILHSL